MRGFIIGDMNAKQIEIYLSRPEDSVADDLKYVSIALPKNITTTVICEEHVEKALDLRVERIFNIEDTIQTYETIMNTKGRRRSKNPVLNITSS